MTPVGTRGHPPTATVTLPAVGTPRVSVLMPLYGRADLAVAALASLAAHTPACYEVIVVDNASPDGAGDRVAAAVHGAEVIASALNTGFGAAIDLAALHARGELLLLLNSDVIVEPGWLEPLLEVLDRHPSVAAVSPALLDADGALTEMGAVVLPDGSTATLADGAEWDLTRPRPVLYASAACLLIRRRVFSAIGGFDTVYARGYYEDVELALELRRQGMQVMCHPGSRVRHERGASTSPARAVTLNLFNRSIFRERWAGTLAAIPADLAAGPLRARDHASVDRVLVIDDRIPQSDRGSGDPRMALLLDRIAARHPAATVSLLAVDPTCADRYRGPLTAAGIEVADWRGSTAEAWIEARRGHYSAVVVSRARNVDRFRPVIDATQPQAIKVVDVEAVIAVRTARQAQLLGALGSGGARALELEARRWMEAETAAWRWADVVTCVSTEEAELVRRAAPGSEVVVLAWAVPPPTRIVPRDERRDAVFLGGFMSGEDAPNADGVRHLVDDLMPKLWTAFPELHLTVAGSDPTPSVLARAGDRVTIAGRVDDPVATLERHLVQLIPLRFGSGIKLKLIESIACGTPFVTTSVGAEGLRVEPLADLLVADTEDEWYERTARLLTDAAAWERAQCELLAIGGEHFGQAAFDRAIDLLTSHLGMVRP